MKLNSLITCVLIIIVSSSPTNASRLNYEKRYLEIHCKGHMEVVMPDQTRCDCVTDTHAIEYDFGNKWSEAIGQCLNYSMQTNKRAGIVLIIERQKDMKFWIRLNSIIRHYSLPIDTWLVEPKEKY